jgi:hypothetical protein
MIYGYCIDNSKVEMWMKIVITGRIRTKLKEKHNVEPEEVEQCFGNRLGRFLEDTREAHRTSPPTQWFIAETDSGRKLKIVFVNDVNGLEIKTAYEPNDIEEKIYEKYS